MQKASHTMPAFGTYFLSANHTPDTSESLLWERAKVYMRGGLLLHMQEIKKRTLKAKLELEDIINKLEI